MFWTVCIPVRLTLASLGDNTALRVFALVIGSRWSLGLEMGVEGVFGGPAWWAEDRRVHGLFWLVFALTGDSKWLKIDTFYGIQNWVRKRALPKAV